MNRAVFLDRDGVINKVVLRDGRPYPPPSLTAFEFLPGAVEAISRLHSAGLLIIVVTNQPDVRTGVQKQEVMEAIHDRISSACTIDDIIVCNHVDEDHCSCRKPKEGMLLTAARRWCIGLGDSFLIGDRWRDIAAGKAVGCRTYLIDYGYAEKQADSPDSVVTSLSEASNLILEYLRA